MYDILVYLFETYLNTDAYPETRQLAHKLSAAGFEEDEINEALTWLAGLPGVGGGAAQVVPDPNSLRVFDDEEMARLGSDCRGFLQFLEDAGVVDGTTREAIIERSMALPEGPIELASFKVIVLMVLWSRREPVDALLVEELLSEQEERLLH
jgi:Smg protein